jgi:hypothetical protein
MKNILRKFLGIALVLTLLFTGITPIINAQTDSLTGASVLISDSAPDVTANYEFTFTTASEIPTGGDIRISFPTIDWLTTADPADVTCPDGNSADVTSNYVMCDIDSGNPLSADSYSITVNNVEHPAKSAAEGVADTYTINLLTRDAETTPNVIEKAQVMVALVEPITVTATVNASLTFVVTGVNSSESVHGGAETTDVTTTATSIPFGVLAPDVPKVAAQDLAVATNASDGFTVTIFQDGNMVNAAGDEISSFEDDSPVATSAAKAWTAPSATLDVPTTYGHFGFSSEDSQVDASCLAEPGGGYFDGNLWAGLTGTTPEEIMCHVGPSDGTTEHKGTTRIGFQAEVSSLQPAGEYRNTLTYIATPTF